MLLTYLSRVEFLKQSIVSREMIIVSPTTSSIFHPCEPRFMLAFKVRSFYCVVSSWMSVHIQNWYFVSKIIFPNCEKKKLFSWSRKTFEIRGWRVRICNIFEITRTIYSNSERSEQVLVTEYFFNLFLEVSKIFVLEQLKFKEKF